MATQYDEDEYDYEDEASSGKGLRAQIKKLLAEKEELQSKLSTFEVKETERSVTEILAAKGVNSKVAKYLLADGVSGEEAINAWLDENADVFGFSINADEASETTKQVADVNPDTVKAVNRLNNLGQSAQTPGKLQDIETRMANASNEAELAELWKEAQGFLL